MVVRKEMVLTARRGVARSMDPMVEVFEGLCLVGVQLVHYENSLGLVLRCGIDIRSGNAVP